MRLRFIVSDCWDGEEPFVDAAEVVVGGRQLLGAFGVVRAIHLPEHVAQVAVFAVLLDARLDESVDMRGESRRVDGEEVTGCRDDKLACEVYFLHILDQPWEFGFHGVDVIRDIFICEKSVGISGKLLSCFFFHGVMDKELLKVCRQSETDACRKVSIFIWITRRCVNVFLSPGIRRPWPGTAVWHWRWPS